MFSKSPIGRTASGFTLLELLLVIGISGIILVGLGAFSLYSTRSFYAANNYTELNQENQQALDRMTREIRQSRRVDQINSTNITLVDSEGQKLSFTYFDANHPLSPETIWMSHSSGGSGRALLQSCRPMSGRPIFEGFRRTPLKGAGTNDYEFSSTTDVSEVKLVQISWSCSRDILLGDKKTTESVQTAKVVIRYNQANSYATTFSTE